MFEYYPFKETLKFNCADAVIECDDEIVLVKRKNAPGKGCWALPGGFVNSNETYQEASIREAKEETGIDLFADDIIDSEIFDDPNRNSGIPRITKAFHFMIKGVETKSCIKAVDDAADVKWFSIEEIKNMNLFDDHNEIIEYFISNFNERNWKVVVEKILGGVA